MTFVPKELNQVDSFHKILNNQTIVSNNFALARVDRDEEFEPRICTWQIKFKKETK